MANFFQALTVIVHFFMTECRAILIFYLSMRSFLSGPAQWFYEHVSLSFHQEQMIRSMNATAPQRLGDFMDCLGKDFAAMVTSMSSGFEGECLKPTGPDGELFHGLGITSIPQNFLFSIINYSGMAIVIVFIAVLLIDLFTFAPEYFGSGRYIAYTLHVRELKGYKACAITIAVLCFVLVLLFFCLAYRVYATIGFGLAKRFVFEYVETLGGLAFAGLAFALPEEKADPIYCLERFQAMKIKRSIATIFTDNAIFIQQVDNAALTAAATGDREILNNYTGEGFASAEDLISFVSTKQPRNYHEKRPLISS